MAGASRTTTDHDKIRSWTEARGGYPATVQGHSKGGEASSVLRIVFEDHDELLRSDWDEFFRKFEDEGLALVYQEKTSDGETSRFCKFVSR